ncbi:DUF6241 domain-containing protein [Bacillus sp. DX1.1]|uniref:DUF6241 domain-containing protein n=1 Tax=unclassified Bacillus (in: firmicutes) TaxID=185979 RepID=UPI002570C8D1|nr:MULTISPECIES: DUF6241 domain-containing protein [unclassified Bacillus (in: firmicutes)]MDM5153325.1 DUF6241 domain-containing protein [Bacillus sp. DX1.1]WJE82283.1 DUF6241 domain-containing protein [Bacillus sp. DX3.1]
MKKKLLYWVGSIAGLALVGFGIFYGLTATSTISVEKESVSSEAVKEKKEEPVLEEKDSQENTAQIEGVDLQLDIDNSSPESAVIAAMHKMTHQKVRAQEKWGAIPMTKQGTDLIYNIVAQSSFKEKDRLLQIAERWKNRDFSQISDDHNFFWTFDGGTIGKAYGMLNTSEERTFAINNFGEEMTGKLVKSGDLSAK